MNTNISKPIFLEKVVLIIIGGILDFLINFLFNIVLHVPLFLDTTFVIALLFIYGPIESFFVYIVESICTCIRLYLTYGQIDFFYLYSLSAITIILTSWIFIRKREKLTGSVNSVFLYILGFSILAAILCSFVSGIISYKTFQQNNEEWAFDKIIFSLKIGNFGVLGTCIAGRIPITVLDRIITTFTGFGLYKIYKRFKNEK